MSSPVFALLHHIDGDPAERPTERIYDEVLEQVVLADEVGLDLIWFAEHHGTYWAGRLPAPWLFIIKAAERTRRVTLGTAVTLLSFQHPLTIAEQFAVADHLTGGRVLLGLGSGASPADFAAFGLDPAAKRPRLREGLEVLRHLWTGEPVTYQGDHYQVTGARLVPPPGRPWRDLLWMAAGSPEAARLAGEFDTHLLLARSTPLQTVRDLVATYSAARQEAGHTADDRLVQRTWLIYVDETDEAARAVAGPSVRLYYNRMIQRGQARLANDDDVDVVLRHFDLLAGGPETIARQLATRIRDFGLTHVALHTRLAGISHESALRSTALLGQRVLPRVRALLAAPVAVGPGH